MYYVYWIRDAAHSNVFDQGYVGITNNPSKRMTYHTRGTNGDNNALHEAILCGAEMTILHEVPNKQAALSWERIYRPQPNIGWNIIPGGTTPPDQSGKKFDSPDHGMRNKTHSVETKQRMSNARTGWKWWNNGARNVRCEVCPEGFKPGRIVNYKYKLTESGKKNLGRAGRKITTPYGQFASMSEAARQLDMTNDQVKWRVEKDKWVDWKYC